MDAVVDDVPVSKKKTRKKDKRDSTHAGGGKGEGRGGGRFTLLAHSKVQSSVPGGGDGGRSSRSAGEAGLDRARRESAPLAVRRSGSEQHRLVDRPEGCRVRTVREVWREGRLGREEGKRGRGWVLPAAEASDAESKPSVWRGSVEINFGRGQNRRSPRGPTRGFRARGITRYIQVNYRRLRLEDERLVGTTEKTKQGLRLQGGLRLMGGSFGRDPR